MAIHSPENSSSSVLAKSSALATKNDDCYFYYYKSCTKGNQCPFRHEPAALRNETMCRFWLQGHCSKPQCIFRHMEISQPRDKVPCFFESQPGGCKKVHCAFFHNNVLDQPREEDKAKNPDIILPLAGSRSPSDDDQSLSSIFHAARSLFKPVHPHMSSYNRRSSSSILMRSRSCSRSPDYTLPPPHPPLIVTVSDLESDSECDSPRKPWMPRPQYKEVYQDPILTKEKLDELYMLHKIQEEQAGIIGYVFDKKKVDHVNGGQSNDSLPNFVDEIEEFDVEYEEGETILPVACNSTSESSTHFTNIATHPVSRIGTVIGNRVERNIILQPSPVKAHPAPPSRTDAHHSRITVPSPPASHHHVTSTSSPGSHHHHRHHVSSTSSHGSPHHHAEASTISSSSHRSSPTSHSVSSPTSSSWSPNADSSHHLPSQSGIDSRNKAETSDVLRPGGGGRRQRRGGLAGALIADALGSANTSSKYHGGSKRSRDDRDRSVQSFDHRDRPSRNGSSYESHREGGLKDVHQRSSDRNDRYSGSGRRDSSSERSSSRRKRSLPREFTTERDAKRRAGSDVHRHSEHHFNNISNGIDTSSSLRSSVSSTGRHVSEVRKERSNRKISLHERFAISDGSDLPNDSVINSSVDASRSARLSSHNTRDREHSRNREDSSSRKVRTRIDFPKRSSRGGSRSRSPVNTSRPVVGEIKIKSLSEIRKEKANKFAAQTMDTLKTELKNNAGLKRKHSSVLFDKSDDTTSRHSKSNSIKRARLDPEAASYVPSSVHRRIVDISDTKSSHDSTAQLNCKVSVNSENSRGASTGRKHDLHLETLDKSLHITSSSRTFERSVSSAVGDSSASSKSVEEEEELLLTQYDEVDYEVDDIEEMELLL